MKKNFPLQAPGKDDARVRDKIRHEINKYVRRCRRKPVTEGFMQWEFVCRVGRAADTAEALPLKEVGSRIDTVAEGGATTVYVEIEAVPARPKPAPLDGAIG